MLYRGQGFVVRVFLSAVLRKWGYLVAAVIFAGVVRFLGLL